MVKVSATWKNLKYIGGCGFFHIYHLHLQLSPFRKQEILENDCRISQPPSVTARLTDKLSLLEKINKSYINVT